MGLDQVSVHSLVGCCSDCQQPHMKCWCGESGCVNHCRYPQFYAVQVGQDDVDLLFAEYEAQAAADRAHTEQKSRQMKQKLQKSMKELRQEGLEAPIAKDNK